MHKYPRDLVGYGANPPKADWPGGARLALQIVMNYEEGGESDVLHGDTHSETLLSDTVGIQPVPTRHFNMESLYEYGSRVGVWRLLKLFRERKIPITVFTVGMAAERNPAPVKQAFEDGHEICSHSYRWIDYQWMLEDQEREHIRKTVEVIRSITGERPVGWYTGKPSPYTRKLVVEEGGFLYDSDSYADDLPYWVRVEGKPHLIVPYTLDNNDMKFGSLAGFVTAEQYFNYLKDAFDALYAEGAETPRMMSVGTHCRLVGRPGRFVGLPRFLDSVLGFTDVWSCRRMDIARHWIERHPFQG